MNVKFLYGLPALLKPTDSPTSVPSFLSDKQLRFKFESCDRMTIPAALVRMASGENLDAKDVVIESVFSTNEALAAAINTLKSIEFIGKHTQVEVYEFAETDYAEVTDYHEVNLQYLRAETGLPNLFLSKYVVVRDSTVKKLKSYSGKVIESKSWNIAGEYTNDDYEVVKVKREKPKPFTKFTDVIQEICPHISEEEFDEVFKACVKIETKSYVGEDSWRDYCFYRVKMSDVERILDKMGYLLPYLRKIKLNALLDVISSN